MKQKQFFQLNHKPVLEAKQQFKNNLDCDSCGLYKNCITPKMGYTGKGKLKILILAEAPGSSEDKKGIQLIGQAGQVLRKALKKINVDLDNDCWKTNAVICRPKNFKDGNRTPTNKEINCCRPNLFKTIEELKPEKIIVSGEIALQSLIGQKTTKLSINKYAGWKIPDQDLKCWIFPTYHPSYLLRDNKNIVLKKKFEKDLKEAFSWDKPFPEIPEVEIIKEAYPAKIFLESIVKLANIKPVIAIDYETTGLKPEAEGHKIYTIGISYNKRAVAFPIFYGDKEFMRLLKRILYSNKIGKIAQNLKFEDRWTRKILGYKVNNWIADTMLGSHILDNRTGITGLKFQTYVNFGIIGYDKHIEKYLKADNSNSFNAVKEAPLDNLLKYNAMDALFTEMLWKKQYKKLEKNNLLGAYNLFHEGTLELSQIETNGININLDYYLKTDKLLDKKINRYKNKINESKEVKKYGKDFNPNSHPQLKELLFDILKYKSFKKTAKDNDAIDEEALEKINTEFTNNILKYKKLDKLKNTYLKNFIIETVDNYMHPFFGLNTVQSFRSSSFSPNFQNIPVRDEEAKKYTRKGIIPRKGHQLLEVDYGSIEVRMAACNTKDPNMINYIKDISTDMHRDMAIEIYKKNDITKMDRYLAKNQFVFPEFYGSWFAQCATNIWNNKNLDIETKEHLKNTFRTYSKFEKHVEKIEKDFWENRFPVYNEWREKTWLDYQKKGYIELLTGFKCIGLMKRKEVFNYPIQGVAFHCLLWSLIQLNKYLRKNKFNSLIIGQIHDSIIMDIDPKERNYLLPVIKEIMCEDIRKHWPWIIVPLSVEAEISPIDGDWTQKEVIEI